MKPWRMSFGEGLSKIQQEPLLVSHGAPQNSVPSGPAQVLQKIRAGKLGDLPARTLESANCLLVSW